jgi:hypothetical protein
VAAPDLIPIKHRPDYHTDTIGRYAKGQFYAAVRGAHRVGEQPSPERRNIRWYAYLHRFDVEGHHVGSEIELIDVGPNLRGEVGEAADAKLAELLAGLPEREYCDIKIRTFELQFDGVRFGLVDESDEDRGDWAELYPDNLGFSAPWDGDYDT